MEIYGLTDEEVRSSRDKYGTNEIIQTEKNSFFKLFIESLGDPMIKILLIVLAIKLVFLFADFNWFETLGILIAIFLASFISTISEYGSDKAFKKLLESNNQKACKVRIKVTENDSTNVIPVIFINPDEKKLIQCKNKDLSIIGHIETKWNTRIIVDAYKTEDDDSVQCIITNNNSH